MPIFQCTGSERREIHIHVEAEDKKAAAKKAMALFKQHGTLVLDESICGMWTGPEEADYDDEIEVTMALDEGSSYWDEPEFVTVPDE